ncbi:MAG: putative selenium-dependent hydroxylase accessory protein YqeC [Chloroflexi bacterium]|nr:putative selenium-dependent hydroxylase accessory protein YqeC [Chloroflexota bacterium]
MDLSRALRISSSPCLAFTGAGGKTTALFQLARQCSPAIVSASTHLHVNQIALADCHQVASLGMDLSALASTHRSGVLLVTGEIQGERATSLTETSLWTISQVCKARGIPFLIEADGSRQRALKAPAAHEPAIPGCADGVVVVAGLTGLGKPLAQEHIHRPEIFARLSGMELGQAVPPDAVVRVLAHPSGGLKQVPARIRRVALLNQADTPGLQAQAGWMADHLLNAYDAVIVASLKEPQPAIHAVHEPVAGIILAAGESTRFGLPKQLLDWRGRPFIRCIAETALSAGLSPVVVVTGANSQPVEAAILGLPVTTRYNPHWHAGQSKSIHAGLQAMPPETGAAIFLLSDQPQVTPSLLRALVEGHAGSLSPVLAPLVDERRANPVLFDRDTFPALMALSGDTGGRGIFDQFPPQYLPWYDSSLLLDVDTPEDYRRLLENG